MRGFRIGRWSLVAALMAPGLAAAATPAPPPGPPLPLPARVDSEVDRGSRRPAVGLSYTQLDPRGIIAGVLDAAGASSVNRSRIVDKGRPVTTPALRLAYDVALFDPLALGPVASLAMHAGAFAEFSTTEFPGASLQREGAIAFEVPGRRKPGARSPSRAEPGIQVAAEYEMKGTLTSYVLGGRADSTAWIGRGPYQLGARLRILAGAMMFMGTAQFATWLGGLPSTPALASADVDVLGMGPLLGGTAGPVVRIRGIECGGGVGFHYERAWVSVDGDFSQLGAGGRRVKETVGTSSLAEAFDVECALPF